MRSKLRETALQTTRSVTGSGQSERLREVFDDRALIRLSFEGFLATTSRAEEHLVLRDLRGSGVCEGESLARGEGMTARGQDGLTKTLGVVLANVHQRLTQEGNGELEVGFTDTRQNRGLSIFP